MPLANTELVSGLGPRMQLVGAVVNERFAAILKQRGYVP
jgi:hypothetical protein